jgi:haloacetate dehalogenase
VHARVGGTGPPLLLLHGFPQTHLMWHSTAPLLAERFTVVAADLPGYGDSFRPPVSDDHSAHSKRAMATDMVEAMTSLGFESFALAGHDRGGRVGYRMALDHPGRVERLAVLDIVPTGEVWSRADALFALGYWHWGFLAQAAPLPEELINGMPDRFFDLVIARQGMALGTARYPDDVVEAYRRRLRDPASVEAMCEDYRAGASVDREHDGERERRIACPTLALWGSRGALPLFYGDVLAVWREWCEDVSGRSVEGSHCLAEDAPEEVASELAEFFA